MQYFCGLHEFTDKPIFDPSLFVTIRKRISEEELNKMTVKLLNKQKRLLEEKRRREEEEAKKNDEEPPMPEPEDPNAASFADSKGCEHKGARNEIECSFGTGKRIYRANDIRAKLPDTARCWTGMCYFVKNVMKFLRELCLVLTEIWRIFIIIVTMRGYVRYPLSVTKN